MRLDMFASNSERLVRELEVHVDAESAVTALTSFISNCCSNQQAAAAVTRAVVITVLLTDDSLILTIIERFLTAVRLIYYC